MPDFRLQQLRLTAEAAETLRCFPIRQIPGQHQASTEGRSPAAHWTGDRPGRQQGTSSPDDDKKIRSVFQNNYPAGNPRRSAPLLERVKVFLNGEPG